MASRYAVAVIEADTQAVVTSWPPQKSEQRGPFIDALCARVTEKGIGFGATAEHVCQDLRDAWHELVREVKSNV